MRKRYYILTKEEAKYDEHDKRERVVWRGKSLDATYADFLDGDLLLLDYKKIGKILHWASVEEEIAVIKDIFGAEIRKEEAETLFNMTIDNPSNRGKGHGTEFYKMFEEMIRNEGRRYIIAWSIERPRARKFFESMGFQLKREPPIGLKEI